MWHYGADWVWWGWIPMMVGMLAFWGLVIWGVVALVRRTAPPPPREPRDILAERFAAGEIEHEEYRRRLDALSAPRR